MIRNAPSRARAPSAAMLVLLLTNAPAWANHGPGASGGGAATISGEILKSGHFEFELREDYSQFQHFDRAGAIERAMNGGDNSVTGGVISATTLIVANGIVGRLSYKNKTLERLIEGRPEILIHNGKLFTDVMQREKLTHHEVNAALRTAGCACIEGHRPLR